MTESASSCVNVNSKKQTSLLYLGLKFTVNLVPKIFDTSMKSIILVLTSESITNCAAHLLNRMLMFSCINFIMVRDIPPFLLQFSDVT